MDEMQTDRLSTNMTRRRLIGAVVTVTFGTGLLPAAAFGDNGNDILSRDSVLRDPEIPALGNPRGDLTVVEFFDYQCPFCKKLAPEITQVIREDGNIRLVLKDWPIFGDVSTAAAKLALATKYQNKYE